MSDEFEMKMVSFDEKETNDLPVTAKLTLFSKGSADIRFSGIWYHQVNADIQCPYPASLRECKDYIIGILDMSLEAVPVDNIADPEIAKQVDVANSDLTEFRTKLKSTGQTIVHVGEEMICRVEFTVAVF